MRFSFRNRMPRADAPRGLLARLGRDRSGVAAIEFGLIFPMLVTLFAGGFTLFEMFRFAERQEAATATTADIASRYAAVDDEDTSDLHTLFARLIFTPTADARLRVVSIEHVQTKAATKNTPAESELRVKWVYDSKNGNSTVLPSDIDLDDMPLIAVGDSILVVNTWATGDTMFDILTPDKYEQDYTSRAIVRPRYVASIVHRDISS